ncbi:unnamed protein product [marine sediment metagenome]|uniref:Uncharacterized protein n=1 Tax=marine sediment metagenome TaxID=412755 RepID=X1R644_9ZZZZ
MRDNRNQKLRRKTIDEENPQIFAFLNRFGTQPEHKESNNYNNLKSKY